MKNWQRADAHKVEGGRRRGRPRLWWEVCIKRNLERVREEWRTTAIDRRSWRLLIDNVVGEKLGKRRGTKRKMANLTPDDRDAKRSTVV